MKNETTHTKEEALPAENLGDMASHKAEAASLPDQSSSGVSTTLSNTRIHLNSRPSDENDAMSKPGTNLTTNTTSNEDHEQHPRLEDLFRTPPGLCSLEAIKHQETRQQDWDNFASITDFEDPASQERSSAARKDSETQPSLDKQTLERLSNVPRYACPYADSSNRYRRKGDLTRHILAHQPTNLLCHFRHCPRSIKGKGFARKDKLVDHLMSKMHGLNKDDAWYEATKNNAH